MIAIEPALHQICCELKERSVVAWMHHGRAPGMMANVECKIVDPLRGTEIQRMRAQDLMEPRDFRQPRTKARNEIREFGCRTVEDRQRTDGQADMRIGVFDLQECRVKSR